MNGHCQNVLAHANEAADRGEDNLLVDASENLLKLATRLKEDGLTRHIGNEIIVVAGQALGMPLELRADNVVINTGIAR